MSDYKIAYKADIESNTNPELITWEEGCPLIVEAIQVSRDVESGNAYLQAKIRNLSSQTVMSFRAIFSCSFDDGSSEEFDIRPLDADIAPGGIYSIQPFSLKGGNISDASAAISSAVLPSGEWESSGSPRPIPARVPLNLSEEAMLEREVQLSEQGCSDSAGAKDFCFVGHDSWTQCACGEINVGCGTCMKCGLEQKDQSDLEDEEKLCAAAKERAEIAREKAEKDLARKAKNKKLLIKMLKITGVIAAVAIVFALIFAYVISPAIKYGTAEDDLKSGKYAEATRGFEELADYRDAKDKADEARALRNEKETEEDYQSAVWYFGDKQYSIAQNLFNRNKDYKETAYYLGACYMEEGKLVEALECFNQVGSDSKFASETTQAKKRCYFERGKYALSYGRLFSAQEWLTEAGDYENSPQLLEITNRHVNYPGIYQQDSNKKEFVQIKCSINPNTLVASYEVYFQDDISEDSYIGPVLQSDGSLLVIDTLDGSLSTKYDSTLITSTSNLFQPDKTVYKSKAGSFGTGPSGISKKKISFLVNGDTLTNSYHYAGTGTLNKKDFDNEGTTTYTRISDKNGDLK